MPFASLLFGDVFRLLSPWRAIGRAVGWVVARVAPAEPLPYPERLGRWPAAAGIFAFGVCELCWAGGREPQTLAILALVYLVVSFVGMSLYGVEPWTRNADPFGVYFGLFASLAPLARRDGVLYARLPVTGAVGLDPVPGTVALLLCAIGITAFDGGSEGPLFNSVAPDLQDLFTSLGAGTSRALELTFCLGLAVTVLLIAAIYWGAIAGMGRRGLRRPRVARRARPLARAHARADRRRLRRRALLLARRLQRAGHLAAGLRPARRRQRPVRRRRTPASTTPSSRRRRSGTSRSARS